MAEATETVQEKLKVVEELLSKYEEGLFLDRFSIKDVNFEEDIKKLKDLSPEDIHYVALDWGYYVVGLQKQINKHQTHNTWAAKSLKMLLAKEAPKYNGFKYEERLDQALVENSYARALYDLEKESKLHIERLAFLTQKIDYLITTARELVKTKQYARRDQ